MVQTSEQSVGILALNSGSSSLKFGIYSVEGAVPVERLSGTIDGEDGQGLFTVELTRGPSPRHSIRAASPLQALYALNEARALPSPSVIGHRIVHGGLALRQHVRVDDSVLRKLDAAREFAPLHVPPALKLLDDATTLFPGATQIACLDTAFHRSMPELARTLPLPATLRDHGVERLGFHGLSCESVVHQLGDDCPPRTAVAHLGSGCSITALRNGQSIDTSMGLTPTGGVIMATRPGDLDPGVLIYLLRHVGRSLSELETLLEQHSGLAGISDGCSDVRELLARTPADGKATLALNQFVRSVAKGIAGMIVTLGGIDLLVFTGGIGEHAPTLRTAIIDQLAPLAPGLAIRVLPSRENDCIARHAWKLACH